MHSYEFSKVNFEADSLVVIFAGRFHKYKFQENFSYREEMILYEL